MNDEINYQNNPLHGVGLKQLLSEIVDHYGFEILYAYLGINCFKTKPDLDSSVKFLKKTDWAREKVESFYLYQFKNLPRATPDQFELPPRDRLVPAGQAPGEPAELSLEDADRLREKRAKKFSAQDHSPRRGSRYSEREQNAEQSSESPRDSRPAPTPYGNAAKSPIDPYAKWRK